MELIRRWCIILLGGVVVAVGLVLMPLPGPGGLPVTIAGLAILATELPWARRFLERLKQRVRVSYAGPVGAMWWWRIGVAISLLAAWIVGGVIVWRVWAY